MKRSVLAAVLFCSACTGTIETGASPEADPDPERGMEGPGVDGGTTAKGRLGYPVGDRVTYPAGGWEVWQVLGHYWAAWGGRHLAQDLAAPSGGAASVGAPVYSVGSGVVRYAGENSSSYANVVLIEHELDDGEHICSFYGHIADLAVETGDRVDRGQRIAAVLDWAVAFGGPTSNTHLHYVLLSKELCDVSAAAGGGSICGYDKGGANGVVDLDTEPATYTAVNDLCLDSRYPDSFLSPTQVIEAHHFQRGH